MEPTWVLSAPDGPQMGPMNLAIREAHLQEQWKLAGLPGGPGKLTQTEPTGQV